MPVNRALTLCTPDGLNPIFVPVEHYLSFTNPISALRTIGETLGIL